MKQLVERALFIVAPQDSGKSTQLRSMFLDHRLGSYGEIPSSRNIPEIYHLSNERRLYLRLTSPHENDESPKAFLSKTKIKMGSGRWCFASPLQPEAHQKMPDVVESVQSFNDTFEPERIRVVFLSPTRHNIQIEAFLPGRDLMDELVQISGVEVTSIDARRRESNGLFLADFFNFT